MRQHGFPDARGLRGLMPAALPGREVILALSRRSIDRLASLVPAEKRTCLASVCMSVYGPKRTLDRLSKIEREERPATSHSRRGFGTGYWRLIWRKRQAAE